MQRDPAPPPRPETASRPQRPAAHGHAWSPEDEEREAAELARRLRPRPPRWHPPAA